MSVGDMGELSGHKSLGGEEDRNLNLKKSRFKLNDNMGNGNWGTPSCICSQGTMGKYGIHISHDL